MAERSWYIASDGRQEGPFPETEIRAFIAAGRVTAETLVWSEGMTAWQRAGDIPGLIPAAAASPPPLTPRPAPLPGSGQWAAAGPGMGNEAGTPFTADFGVWSLLGRVLILGIGTLLVIPAPWVATSFYRWFIEHVHVPQIPALGFAGKAGDIWWVFILIAVLTYLGLPAAHTDSNGHVHEAMFLPYLLIPVKAVLSWYVLRWVIEKITASRPAAGAAVHRRCRRLHRLDAVPRDLVHHDHRLGLGRDSLDAMDRRPYRRHARPCRLHRQRLGSPVAQPRLRSWEHFHHPDPVASALVRALVCLAVRDRPARAPEAFG